MAYQLTQAERDRLQTATQASRNGGGGAGSYLELAEILDESLAAGRVSQAHTRIS